MTMPSIPHPQHLALVRQVMAAVRTGAGAGPGEPTDADLEAGLALLGPVYTDVFGPRPLDTLCLVEGMLLALFRRAAFGTLRPARDVKLAFGLGTPGDHDEISVDQVPEPDRTFSRLVAASLTHDWPMYVALFDAFHGGEPDRARELIEYTFRHTAHRVATVPCTCPDHRHG